VRRDEALARLGVVEIACRDQRFDPHHMQAVDVAEQAGVADESVLAVYRRGYTWRGAVLRPAHVKVARARRAVPDPEESL